MSDRNGNFLGGFLLGTLVGGVVGGVAGVLAASRLTSEEEETTRKKRDRRKRQSELTFSTEEEMEAARRGLEDKIAQLNEAIDDVRFQLNSVNGQPVVKSQESSISRD